jgi:hypothetical protein
MIILDSHSYRTEEGRLTLYIDQSYIYMMTGPFESNDKKIKVRYLYLEGFDYPLEILNTEDNYNKVIKVLESR